MLSYVLILIKSFIPLTCLKLFHALPFWYQFRFPTSSVTFHFVSHFPTSVVLSKFSSNFQLWAKLSNFNANFPTAARTFQLHSFQFHFGLSNFSFFSNCPFQLHVSLLLRIISIKNANKKFFQEVTSMLRLSTLIVYYLKLSRDRRTPISAFLKRLSSRFNGRFLQKALWRSKGHR